MALSVVTLVGGGGAGLVNGVGTNAKFNSPKGFTMSKDKTFLLVADTGNHVIRHINLATLDVTTVAGDGTSGYGDATVGTSAKFNSPADLGIHPDGSYALIGDAGNHCIRKLTLHTYEVSTYAGTCGQPGHVWVC